MAVFLTFTGVYDAVTTLPFWLGWCYWMLTLVVGCLVGYFVILGLDRLRAHIGVQYGMAILASTAAVTSVILMLQIQFQNPVPPEYIPGLFLQVLVISFMIFTIGILAQRAVGRTPANDIEHDPVKHFLENLPMKYRNSELYAISSEDHYLRVHTSQGEELILMRLADAIHNLKEADGLQTHRSWWVASSGIAEVVRDNGRTGFVLKSGATAPVSRTYQPAVKAANWF